MSGGQQGGPMGGGGKGGTQQMPSGGGKGGPQGHMMPNGQPQGFPGMPTGGGVPQQPQVSQWHGGGLPKLPTEMMPSFAGFNPGGQWQQARGQPQGNFGMPQSPQQQPTPMRGLLAKLYGG